MHGDFISLMCGIVYWAAIPSCFILLQIYSIANLNDCSWGTRQAGGGGDAKTKTPCDKAMDTVMGCMCKDDEEPVKAPEDVVETDKPTYKTREFETKKGEGHISAVSDPTFTQNLEQLGSEEFGGILSILGDQIKQQTEIKFNTSWILSSQSPLFFQNDPAFDTLSDLETQFWSGMVNKQHGFIRNFRNDEQLKRKNEELTDEMDNFRDKLYGYFLYMNLVWLIYCTLAQNYISTTRFKTVTEH